MKKILIATDFSPASRNASLYGVALAKAMNAKIILYNAYKIPKPAPGLNMVVSRYDIKMHIDKQLLEEADRIDPGNTALEILCDEGVTENAIIDIAREKNVDLILAGMKGSGKNLKKIFGSTALLLAKNSSIPVIIVPENAEFKKPEIIVLASDKINSDDQVPEQLFQFIQLFNSKLFVVNVARNEKIFEVSAREVIKNKSEAITTFDYFAKTDITHALNEFIQTHQADMLAMTPHKHQWFERLFIKSETKDMLFHTHIPLLILPEIIN